MLSFRANTSGSRAARFFLPLRHLDWADAIPGGDGVDRVDLRYGSKINLRIELGTVLASILGHGSIFLALDLSIRPVQLSESTSLICDGELDLFHLNPPRQELLPLDHARC